VRKLGAGELAWVIGLCLLMGSCTRPPPAGTIDAIGINEYTCLPDCHGTAIWLRRSGVASIGDNIGNTDWVTIPPGLFDRLAGRLVQTPLFSSPSDLRENHRSQESASISAIVAGTFHTVSFPAPQAGVPITNDSVSQLLGFVDDVRRETAPLKNRADRAVKECVIINNARRTLFSWIGSLHEGFRWKQLRRLLGPQRSWWIASSASSWSSGSRLASAAKAAVFRSTPRTWCTSGQPSVWPNFMSPQEQSDLMSFSCERYPTERSSSTNQGVEASSVGPVLIPNFRRLWNVEQR